MMPSPIFVQRCASSSSEEFSSVRKCTNSSDSPVEGSGAAPACSYSRPLWTSIVASPPSSRMRFGPPSGHTSACFVHHQYSSSVSPFQAKTGTPLGSSGVPSLPTATAAAAWSWVEKMLQLHQRTSAPSAVSVSIRTAVWIVMCSEPVTRAPLSGCAAPYSSRQAIRPGISCWASSISLRPKAARERAATLKSVALSVVGVVVMKPPLACQKSLGSSCGDAEQALVLLLLPAQPVIRGDALRATRRVLEPRVHGLLELLVLAHSLGERHVREPAIEAVQELAQRAQQLELLGTEGAIAGPGPRRLDQADALEIAQHSRRPPRGFRSLVDG